MPSPIGHSLIGLIVFYYLRPRTWPFTAWILIIVALVSLLPDFDFIPGLIIGEPNWLHRGVSHSFGFAVLLSLVIFILERQLRSNASPRIFLWFFILYSLHIIVDYFGADTRYPYGQPMFWPILDDFLMFRPPLFWDIQRSSELAEFFPSLFRRHNLIAMSIEIGFAGILAGSLFVVRHALRKGGFLRGK